MPKYLMLFCLSILFVTNTYAIFCPTNFQSINIGDSISTVERLCGLPSSQKTQSDPNSLSQEWTYYVRTDSSSQATTKMKIVLQNERIINIHLDRNNPNLAVICNNMGWGSPYTVGACNNLNTVQGEDVSIAQVCGGTLRIGDNSQMLKYLCGAPVNIQQNYQADASGQITEYYYNGPPLVTLVFKNGQLADRK